MDYSLETPVFGPQDPGPYAWDTPNRFHMWGWAPLPKLRGRVQANAPLAPFTWFRAGGAAEILVRPADADDLATLLRELPNDVPTHVIGACSNLIVRDGGLPGVTIKLARGFSEINVQPDGIIAGSSSNHSNRAKYCRRPHWDLRLPIIRR